MYSAANSTAERVAAVYYSKGSDYMTGEISKQQMQGMEPYRRWSASSAFFEEDFENTVLHGVERNSILKSSFRSLDTYPEGNAFSPKVKVELSVVYDNPMGGFTSVWGLGRKIIIKTNSVATIDDPVEFIRNTDFILQTAAKVPEINGFGQSWKQIVQRIIDYIDDITKGLETADG
jgi:hypothetical protein